MRMRETPGTGCRKLGTLLTGTLFAATLLLAVACEPPKEGEQTDDVANWEVSPEFWKDAPDPEASALADSPLQPFTDVLFDPTGRFALHQTSVDGALCL